MKYSNYDGLQIRIPHFKDGIGIFTFHFLESTKDEDLYTLLYSEDKNWQEIKPSGLINYLIENGTWKPINEPTNKLYEIY